MPAIDDWSADLEWLKFGQEYIQKSEEHVESSAKALLTLESGLITVYVGALTYLDTYTKFLPHYWNYSLLYWIIVLSPVIVFLISISFLSYAIFMRSVSFLSESPEKIKGSFQSNTKNKHTYLGYGLLTFVFAIFLASVIMMSIAGNIPHIISPEKVQLVIPSATSISVAQLPIMENNTQYINLNNQSTMNDTLTIPLTYIGQTSSGYLVQLDNGTTIELDKSVVIGIIYPKDTQGSGGAFKTTNGITQGSGGAFYATNNIYLSPFFASIPVR